MEFGQSLDQFFADGLDGPAQLVLGSYVMASGENGHLAELAQDFSPEGIDLRDGIHQVAEEFNADGFVLLVGREDLQDISPDAESPSVKVIVVPLVLDFHQAGQEVIPGYFLLIFHQNDHALVGFGRTQPVNTGDRSHHDRIPAGENGAGSRMAHFVDQVVDGSIFLDVSVRGGEICLRLVIIVITDKILHGIIGEEGSELLEELGRQGFVGSNDQGRLLDPLDDLGHGESLPRPRDPEEDLMGNPLLHSLGELLDGLGLIPFGFEWRNYFKFRHGPPATALDWII